MLNSKQNNKKNLPKPLSAWKYKVNKESKLRPKFKRLEYMLQKEPVLQFFCEMSLKEFKTLKNLQDI